VIESSQRNRAYSEDANSLVGRLKGDVLYLDPPYNQRQYAANYHVLDILAGYHLYDDLDKFEASLYGKTGLRPYDHLKSAYCVRKGRRRVKGANGTTPIGDVFSAMLDLVLSTKARSVVVSYNEEGLLTRDEIGVILARFSGSRAYDFDKDFREISYRRFRSDRDREENGDAAGRSYKVIEGRGKDEIAEWLFFAEREGARVPS
jgi:adenine-specific DNA-methyltransferase